MDISIKLGARPTKSKETAEEYKNTFAGALGIPDEKRVKILNAVVDISKKFHLSSDGKKSDMIVAITDMKIDGYLISPLEVSFAAFNLGKVEAQYEAHMEGKISELKEQLGKFLGVSVVDCDECDDEDEEEAEPEKQVVFKKDHKKPESEEELKSEIKKMLGELRDFLNS